jgi:hypothetical protein
VVDGEEVDFGNQLLVNRLREGNLVDLPDLSVGKDYPIDSLVGCVIDSLLEVLVVKGQADGLGFDEEEQGVINLDRKVHECPPDSVLRCDFGILIITENLGEAVRDNGHSVGLPGIPGFGCLDDWLKTLKAFRDAFRDFLRDRCHNH